MRFRNQILFAVATGLLALAVCLFLILNGGGREVLMQTGGLPAVIANIAFGVAGGSILFGVFLRLWWRNLWFRAWKESTLWNGQGAENILTGETPFHVLGRWIMWIDQNGEDRDAQ